MARPTFAPAMAALDDLAEVSSARNSTCRRCFLFIHIVLWILAQRSARIVHDEAPSRIKRVGTTTIDRNRCRRRGYGSPVHGGARQTSMPALGWGAKSGRNPRRSRLVCIERAVLPANGAFLVSVQSLRSGEGWERVAAGVGGEQVGYVRE